MSADSPAGKPCEGVKGLSTRSHLGNQAAAQSEDASLRSSSTSGEREEGRQLQCRASLSYVTSFPTLGSRNKAWSLRGARGNVEDPARVHNGRPARRGQKTNEHPKQCQVSVRTLSRGGCAGAGAGRQGRSPAPGGHEARGYGKPSYRRGPAASASPHAPLPAPRAASGPPHARPPTHRHLQWPVARHDRHVGIRVGGELPLFHVASLQRHLPAAGRVRRALPASGGKALRPCSGAPVRAGPPRLARPRRAAPSPNSPLGGELSAPRRFPHAKSCGAPGCAPTSAPHPDALDRPSGRAQPARVGL